MIPGAFSSTTAYNNDNTHLLPKVFHIRCYNNSEICDTQIPNNCIILNHGLMANT